MTATLGLATTRAIERTSGRPRNNTPCSVEDCVGRGEIRGWCQTHYNRWYKTGDPLSPPRFAPIHDRIMRRVVVQANGCWEWQGAKTHFGHGVIGRGGGVQNGNVLTHRAVWGHHNGPVPVGMCVLHRCDNPPCVNPEHLWLGTRADNNRDMTAKGRHWLIKRKAGRT